MNKIKIQHIKIYEIQQKLCWGKFIPTNANIKKRKKKKRKTETAAC